MKVAVIPLYIIVSVMLSALVTSTAADCKRSSPSYNNVFRRLNTIRDAKKQQLTAYLNQLQSLAATMRSDRPMIDFFKVKSTYYNLQKKSPPPNEVRNLINELKERIQKHYLHNYLSFYDILFINMNGDIFYTIRKGNDYHQNIFHGQLAATALADELRNNPTQTFVDYEQYCISGKPSAFIVEPVFDKNQQLGWFVLQCDIAKINLMFSEDEDLGATGEAFLVNHDQLMLTDSRFFGESSILKQHLSRENIESKFIERKGNKVVTDYRGFNALSSFEVCPVMGNEWLLIIKIDEDEIITDAFRKNKTAIYPDIKQALLAQYPTADPVPASKEKLTIVDIDGFQKAGSDEILYTPGISSCTAIIISYPGRFSYMTHISNHDKMYDGLATDLTAHIIKRIKNFDIYKHERRHLQVTIVAPHMNSLSNIIDRLITEGFFLSQIRFIHNPHARYANVTHTTKDGETRIEWVMPDNALHKNNYQNASDSPTLGTITKEIFAHLNTDIPN